MFFNIFNSKPKLKELIPKGFVDIHSHVLPGLDDGAKNVEESVMLISEMKNLGFSKIITTPHTYPGLYDNSISSICDGYEKVKSEVPDGVEFFYASEYMIDYSLKKKADSKSLLCIKDNFVLIEMGFIGFNSDFEQIIFDMRLNDYIPIIAHPERYRYLMNDKEMLLKLKKMGCRYQINLLSATGYYGKDISE